jgi:hypothetical protein
VTRKVPICDVDDITFEADKLPVMFILPPMYLLAEILPVTFTLPPTWLLAETLPVTLTLPNVPNTVEFTCVVIVVLLLYC